MSKPFDVIKPPWDWQYLRNIATILQWAIIANGNVWKLKKKKKEVDDQLVYNSAVQTQISTMVRWLIYTCDFSRERSIILTGRQKW